MLNRLRKLLLLSKLNDAHLDYVLSVAKGVATEVQHGNVIDEVGNVDFDKMEALLHPALKWNPLPDTKGEFLSDMSEEEVLAYERNERLGWKNLKMPWRGEPN